eukprot:6133812-Amphidinium_carterae.1
MKLVRFAPDIGVAKMQFASESHGILFVSQAHYRLASLVPKRAEALTLVSFRQGGFYKDQ